MKNFSFTIVTLLITFVSVNVYGDYRPVASSAFSAVTGSVTASQLPSELVQFTQSQTIGTSAVYNIAFTSDSYTKLLIHPGVGSTTFHDISSNVFTLTSTGSPLGTQTNKPFDNASIYLSSGNYFTAPSNSVFDLTSTEDWCWEFWYKRDGTPPNFSTLFGRLSGTNGWAIMLNVGGANGIYLKRHEDSSGGVSYTGMDDGLHHYAFVHDDSQDKLSLFVDNVVVATATASTAINWTNYAEPVYVGHSTFDSPRFAKGWMSEIRISKGTQRYGFRNATYTLKYLDPFLGIETIRIKVGTQSATVLSFNATHTIFGSTTSAYIPGSVTKYVIEATAGGGKILAISYDSPSEETKKVVYSEGTKTHYLDGLKKMRIGEWSWRLRDVNRLDAEVIAKENFVKITQNINDYRIMSSGTSTQMIDVEKMQADYVLAKEAIELEWASTPEQYNLINNVENALETDTEIYLTPFAGDPSTPEILQSKDKKALSLNSQIGYAYEAIKELEAIVGSLTTRLEKARIP